MDVPIWMCIPFAGLLLCIALFPLFAGGWWEKHEGLVVAIWSVLVIVLFGGRFGAGAAVHTSTDRPTDRRIV